MHNETEEAPLLPGLKPVLELLSSDPQRIDCVFCKKGLRGPDAQEVLHRMLADADVLVENFLPGTMERWGLGFDEVLATRYPRLVYCSIDRKSVV